MVLEKLLEECSQLVKELDCLKEILDNYVNCIHVEIIGKKDQSNKSLKEIEASCQGKLQALKDIKEVFAPNFIIVAWIDLMNITRYDHLIMHTKKLEYSCKVITI